MSRSALVVGVGNLLRGDDGFGVEAARRLAAMPDVTARAKVTEVGIGGVHLVQELMDGYELLVIVDAVDRGGEPGRVYVLELEVPPEPASPFQAWQEQVTDPHEALPARALSMARAVGVLPARVLLVGCQPAGTDEARIGLSPRVEEAVAEAVERVRSILDPVAALRQRDEVLQVLFWLSGEGLGPDVALADVLRFVDDPAAVRSALGALRDDGHVEARPDPSGALRYRLTPLGEAEGRRRFLDEFEPYLARHAHGECGTPDCDCHAGGAECRGLG
jgi:hydrogenase maturation protease